MSRGLWGRVEAGEGPARLRTGRVTVAEVVDRLDAGEAPSALVEGLGLEPADVVAALAIDALGGGEGPPLVQGPPHRPRLAGALAVESLAGLYPGVPRPLVLALAAGLLQVHDFWDASHTAAQAADDQGERSVAAYWHGIGHRREPDPGNAAYWFRRVGRHPVFGPLAEAAREILSVPDADPAMTARLVPRGAWDPLAFVEVCSAARGNQVPPARRVQCQEMRLLLETTHSGMATGS